MYHNIVKYTELGMNLRYLIMFDLASKTSGVCIWDIDLNKPIRTLTFTVESTNKVEHGQRMWQELDKLFHIIICEMNIKISEFFVSKEAMPQQLHGVSSTVQTFLALARSHAILDLYIIQHNFLYYDDIGVYPISTHTYLKHLNQWENKHKVNKDDILRYVNENYHLGDLTYDESDAILLAKTLLDIKWNNDIQEQIRINNKHIKALKDSNAIQKWKIENHRLELLMR